MKGNYDMDDRVTFYFVTYKEPGFSQPSIKAWTDDKVLLDFYLKFHNRKAFKVKKFTDTYKEISTMINRTCINDEISLHSLITAKRDGLGKSKVKGKAGEISDKITVVQAPITTNERVQIDDNASTFCSSMIDYGNLNRVLPLLKEKYVKALKGIGLLDVISSTVMSQPTKLTKNVHLDELVILLKFFPTEFQ